MKGKTRHMIDTMLIIDLPLTELFEISIELAAGRGIIIVIHGVYNSIPRPRY